MFEQAARNLIAAIGKTPEPENVERFLADFAEHILWHTTPASGSTIGKFRGLPLGEIIALLPDMPDEPFCADCGMAPCMCEDPEADEVP